MAVVRRLHCEDLHDLYYQPDIIWVIQSRRVRGEHHIAHVEESRNAYSFLTKTLVGKKPLGRSMYRWEDGIMMDLKEI